MSVYVSPGVYVREIDLSLYVPALSTTIVGMVGRSTRGPVNEKTYITSQQQFVEVFGPPDSTVGYETYAALQYLRRGRQLWFVRITGPAATEASNTVDALGVTPVADEVVGTGDTSILIFDHTLVGYPVVKGTTVVSATTATGAFEATDNSVGGFIEDTGGADLDTAASTINYETGTVHLVFKVAPTATDVTASYSYWGVNDESLGTADDATLVFSHTLAKGNAIASSVSVTTTPTAIAVPVVIYDDGAGGFSTGAKVSDGTLVDAVDVSASTINYATGEIHLVFNTGEAPVTGSDDLLCDYSYVNTTDTYTIDAISSGEWGNQIAYTFEPSDTDNAVFKLMVYYEGGVVERYDNLVGDPNDGTNDITTRVNGVSEYITVAEIGTVVLFGPQETTTPVSLIGGSSDASNISAADIIGLAWDETLQQPTGLQLLASPSATDLNVLAAPGWSEAGVVNELINICETRADCMAIIDPPSDLRPSEVVDWHNGQGDYVGAHAAFNSSYAAMYWPWVKVYDSYNRQYVWTPPSGHVLAVFAYTDQATESWFAPAGLNRGRVVSGVDIAYDPTRGEMDLLYGDGNAVNPIERFTKDGIVVWGQRTLQREPTSLDRINVRRLLLYLRKVISTAVRYLVFEPNDETTWKLFGHAVTPFLNDVRQRRGLYDFRVKCDETTNTPAVVDRNQLNAQIFLKPTKAAEFIQVDLVITSSGANFDEILY